MPRLRNLGQGPIFQTHSERYSYCPHYNTRGCSSNKCWYKPLNAVHCCYVNIMFDFWYFELVPPSVFSGALPLLCPSCPLSRESSHVVAVLTGWSLTCHLLISSNTRCRCSAPAPVMVYIALTQAVSFAAQAQILEYFAPASSAYAGRSANCTGSLILPPAPAPAVYAALAPVMVTSR